MLERGSAPRIFGSPEEWPPVDAARLSGVLRRRIVAYLVDGERAGFVTGANFAVDGGMTRKMIYEE